MNLEDTQKLMWQAITWPKGAADFLDQSDPELRARFEQTFRGSDAFDIVARMEVYANAYYWRLHGVLEENFPVFSWALGPVAFRNLLTDYLLVHPSTDPDLRHLGGTLPSFVRQGEHAHWAPIADIEQAMGQALHAPDEPAIELPALLAFGPESWPQLRLRLHSSAQLIACEVDYAALAQARREEAQAPQDPPSGVPGSVLVWRLGFAVKRRRCDPEESAALAAFARGASFLEVCGQLALIQESKQAIAKLPARLSGWMRSWVDSGLLAAVSADPELAEA